MKLKPTKEQQTIIDVAKQSNHIVIEAFAGAAKTSTCIMIAEAVVKPSLYVAFNKSIADEAARRFPSHVICQTMHSLAYRSIIKFPTSPLGKKLQGFYVYDEVKCSAMPKEAEFAFKGKVVEAIKLWCQSASHNLVKFLTEGEQPLAKEDSFLLKAIVQYWNDQIDPSSAVHMTHDTYLKMFQLSKPIFDWEVIYLDEAQDSNPVTLDIVMRQRQAQIIIVGDKYQAIYEWRGAVNAIEAVPEHFKRMFLTESWRFTSTIAEMATKLTALAGNTKEIIGNGTENKDSSKETTAILVRRNATIIEYLLRFAEQGEKVEVLADMQDLFKKLYHIAALAAGERPKYPAMELLQFKDYAALQEAAGYKVKEGKWTFDSEASQADIKSLVDLTNKFAKSGGVHRNITLCKSAIADKVDRVSTTIATIHKSKGLEYDNVTLAEDTFVIKEGQTIKEALETNQTLNLLYVGITRCKSNLSLPIIIEEIINGSIPLEEFGEIK